MSGIDCDEPNHERCDRCGGCAHCGCLCHLVDGPPDEPLVHLEMGLKNFQEEIFCPKCHGDIVRVTLHENILQTIGGEGSHPCAEWLNKGLLTATVTEHLCLRCQRCGYGWPTKTADA